MYSNSILTDKCYRCLIVQPPKNKTYKFPLHSDSALKRGDELRNLHRKSVCCCRNEICNLIFIGLLSGERIRDNLGVRQAYKAGSACTTFPWCPFHRGITWPVTPELVASAAWDEIAHWTGGVYRSLAFSIHSPGRKQPPHASEAERAREGGREGRAATRRYRASLRDEEWGSWESGAGRAERGNFTNSNFCRKITTKWKNNGSGIIGLLAWRY